jgi:hypothetical protein
MFRITHIFRLLAVTAAAAALAAPSALADPLPIRLAEQGHGLITPEEKALFDSVTTEGFDGYQSQNWRLLDQLEQQGSSPVRADVDGYQPQLHGAAQPRGVVGPSVGYERPDGFQPQLSAPATAAAASEGIDWLDATIGAAIGLALGLVLFGSAQVGRRRTRIAHS